MKYDEIFYNKVYDILVEKGEALEVERETFILNHILECQLCKEWRFKGLFGFGGKYRRLTNTIDCYREDETPELLTLIDEINVLLKNIKSV